MASPPTSTPAAPRRIRVIDSHTGGEPTRVVLEGGPELGAGPIHQRRDRLREHHDTFRSAVVNEPRGSDVLVGALLCPPSDPTCRAGVIFFNNVGYLGMCGHGTIGVVATLAYVGQAAPGPLRLETPVGIVTARLQADGRVAVENVPSYRLHKDVRVQAEGHGPVTGDVAWGGNWFFLVHDTPAELLFSNVERLRGIARSIRRALEQQGICGADGAVIDHIELCGPPRSANSDGRNFVLCPGGAYDRSACGTGTSARLACLAADGRLAPGQVWRQESIVGSVLEGSFQWAGDRVIPTITGRAHVTAEATLVLLAEDPFCMGIRA